jgi:hypothetical protein
MIEKKEAQKLLSSLNEMINEYWFDMIIKRWQKLGYIKDNERQDLKLKECLDCNNYNTIICESCQNNAMFKKIQKPKVENINVDDMYIAEKKVDKLEEARDVFIYSFEKDKIPDGFNEDSIWLLKSQCDYQRELYEQIIKEKDETIQYWIGQLGIVAEEKTLLLKNNKQQKPPRKCIEWLRRYDCSKCAKKLLKYFEKN